jgi:hypothetical protein
VDGDVEVKGVVEASNIRSGGKLLVHGGLAGHDGFKVEIASDVHSRFMLEVDLTAGNDVVVDREILHSTIRTPGAVLVAEGRIVGAELSAGRGVEARVVHTSIKLGENSEVGEDAAEPGPDGSAGFSTAQAVVHGCLHAKTEIVIDGRYLIVKDSVQGPLVVKRSRESGDIVIEPLDVS